MIKSIIKSKLKTSPSILHYSPSNLRENDKFKRQSGRKNEHAKWNYYFLVTTGKMEFNSIELLIYLFNYLLHLIPNRWINPKVQSEKKERIR